MRDGRRKACADQALMRAGGKLFRWCGRHVVKVGEVLRAGVLRAVSAGDSMSPAARQTMLESVDKDKFNIIEESYRKELVKRGLYCQKTLPAPLYPPLIAASDPKGVGRPPMIEASATPTLGTASGAALNPEALTEAHVFERLRIKGPEEFVMALIRCESKTVAEDKQPVVKGDTTVVKGETSVVKDEEVVETNG